MKDKYVCITFQYNDNQYYIEQNLGQDDTIDLAEFIFWDGQYACDCRKSLLINSKYGDAFPVFEKCGEEIKMIDFQIEYR